MNERYPRVKGGCVLCGLPLDNHMILGEKVDAIRYVLAKAIWCDHCKLWLVAAIRDASNRWWGRRKVWNE